MSIQYGLGPLIVIVLALLGVWLRARKIALVIALWVTMVLVVTAVATYSQVFHGDWQDVLLLVVTVLGTTSAWDSIWFLREHRGIRLERYYIWWALFWGALAAIVLAENLMVSWVAIEFSTLASGALVVEMGNRRALEAAWKYIVIASVGLALALIGIIFVYAGLRFQGLGWETLAYSNLSRHYHAIAPIVRGVATIFIVSGIGTKVGLVPFHTWLPDAHSEAPSPVSGLLSGALLGLCLVTIERFVAAVPQPPTALLSGPHLLVFYGVLSIAVGSLALLVQRDIKRLLAYSSIEQVGIMAIGFGLGTPLAELAAFLQLVFHAAIKSTLFYLSGHLSAVYHSKRLEKITDMAKTHPGLAVSWSLGILALAGIPPLGLAYSEWIMLHAMWETHQVWLIIVLSLALLVTFAALTYHLLSGLWGGLNFSQYSSNENNKASGDSSSTAAFGEEMA